MPRRLYLRRSALAAVTLAAALPASGIDPALAQAPVAPTTLTAPPLAALVPPSFPPLHTATAPPSPPHVTVKPRPRPRRDAGIPVVAVLPGSTVEVLGRPGGRVIAHLTDTTEFGSRTTAPAYARRGRWLGVAVPQLPNGRLGWIDSRARGVSVSRTHLAVVVRRAARTLELRAGRRVLLRTTVGVGAPGSPTPSGRFAVTDEVAGGQFSPSYGCCVLALSAHQPHPPAGWHNGTRMAIHGTNAPSTIGMAASAGCVHAADATMRTLMRRVPLGTPVLIY